MCGLNCCHLGFAQEKQMGSSLFNLTWRLWALNIVNGWNEWKEKIKKIKLNQMTTGLHLKGKEI